MRTENWGEKMEPEAVSVAYRAEGDVMRKLSGSNKMANLASSLIMFDQIKAKT